MSITIDSSGNSHDIRIAELRLGPTVYDSSGIFSAYIHQCFSSIKWIPGSISGKRIDYKITIPIIFLLNDPLTMPPIIKLGKRQKPIPSITN